MKRLLVLILCAAALVFGPQPCAAETKKFSDVELELQRIVAELSKQPDQYENIQRILVTAGQDERKYDEIKNIWISTVLAVTAVSSICEYEGDLLSLFLDLRKSRKPYFFDVRIQSLDNSIRQVGVMARQVEIGHTMLPEDIARLQPYDRIVQMISQSIHLLTRSRDLVHQMAAGK
jgi:hypothetical protein